MKARWGLLVTGPILCVLTSGEYWLRLGLYRSQNLVHLPCLDAAGHAIADEITLPDPVTLL